DPSLHRRSSASDRRTSALSKPSFRVTPRSLDSTEADVLDLEEVLDAVLGALAAEAGLLDAAEGRDFVGDDADVHADDARLDRLGVAEDASHVARVEVRAHAELAVVRLGDRLGVVLEPTE